MLLLHTLYSNTPNNTIDYCNVKSASSTWLVLEQLFIIIIIIVTRSRDCCMLLSHRRRRSSHRKPFPRHRCSRLPDVLHGHFYRQPVSPSLMHAHTSTLHCSSASITRCYSHHNFRILSGILLLDEVVKAIKYSEKNIKSKIFFSYNSTVPFQFVI